MELLLSFMAPGWYSLLQQEVNAFGCLVLKKINLLLGHDHELNPEPNEPSLTVNLNWV